MQNPKSVGLRSLLALKICFQNSIRFINENYLIMIEDFACVYHKCSVFCTLAAKSLQSDFNSCLEIFFLRFLNVLKRKRDVFLDKQS